MSPLTALRLARREISMYRFGDGYIVSQYDPAVRSWRESHPRPYHAAAAARSDRVMILAGEKLGLRDPEGIVMSLGGGARQVEWTEKVRRLVSEVTL